MSESESELFCGNDQHPGGHPLAGGAGHHLALEELEEQEEGGEDQGVPGHCGDGVPVLRQPV